MSEESRKSILFTFLFPDRKKSKYVERVNRLLAKKSGIDYESIKAFRSYLSSKENYWIVLAWFYKKNGDIFDKTIVIHLTDPSNPTRRFNLKDFFPSRSHFLTWVYPKNPLRSLISFVRTPSDEKRKLLSLILAEVNKDGMQWISSKRIHAFAFRPEFYKKSPLYRTIEITKKFKKGKRKLDIPNQQLKKVQKALRLILSPCVEKHFDKSVYGVAGRGGAQIFKNASEHSGREYIATFDISDFFPSTRISDVIRGLQYLKNKINDPTTGEPISHMCSWNVQKSVSFVAGEQDQKVKTCGWSDDAILLIAKLGTYRGRLPQGSPLSPLLANIAFMEKDNKILEYLQNDFRNGFKYTRYFDDLTFSITRKEAKRQNINTAKDFEKWVLEKILEGIIGHKDKDNNGKHRRIFVFENTKYRVNTFKTRSTRLIEKKSCFHNITGFSVSKNSVSLSRKKRGTLRLIRHKITKDLNLVKTAVDLTRLDSDEKYTQREPKWFDIKRGHCWEWKHRDQVFNKRKIGLEKMAIQMLRSRMQQRSALLNEKATIPTLETIGLDKEHHHLLRRVNPADENNWPEILQRILSYLWTGHYKASLDKKNRHKIFIVDDKDQQILSIELQNDVQLFLLSIEEVSKLVHFWNNLIGNYNFIKACPRDTEFTKIHIELDLLQDSIIEALSLDIKAPAHIQKISAVTLSQEDIEPVLSTHRFHGNASKLIVISERYRSKLNLDCLELKASERKMFCDPSESDIKHSDWLEVLNKICNIGIDRIPSSTFVPSVNLYDGSKFGKTYFDCLALNLYADNNEITCKENGRSHAYNILHEFYAQVPDQNEFNLQEYYVATFVNLFKDFFSNENASKENIVDEGNIGDYTVSNLWSNDINTKTDSLIDKLENNILEAQSSDTGIKLLKKKSLGTYLNLLSQKPQEYEEWPFLINNICIPLNNIIKDALNITLMQDYSKRQMEILTDKGKVVDHKRSLYLWDHFFMKNTEISNQCKGVFKTISACRHRIHGNVEISDIEEKKDIEGLIEPNKQVSTVLNRHWKQPNKKPQEFKREFEPFQFHPTESCTEIKILRMILIQGCVEALTVFNRGGYKPLPDPDEVGKS